MHLLPGKSDFFKQTHYSIRNKKKAYFKKYTFKEENSEYMHNNHKNQWSKFVKGQRFSDWNFKNKGSNMLF